MADPIAISLGAVSIAASAWLTFETQLRRARLRIRILRPPEHWSVKLQRRGVLPGVPFIAGLEELSRFGLPVRAPRSLATKGP
jgi:hypothetical protein